MHEAVFRIEHESLYADITAREDASLDLWCGDHSDLLRVTGADRNHARDIIEQEIGIREWIDDGTESLVVTSECLLQFQKGLLEQYLREHNCLTFYPTSYEGGSMWARVISIKPENLAEMYHDMTDEFTVEVEAKHEVNTVEDAPLMVFDGELPTFSDRQREILLLAFDRGYFEIPKETTTAELAAELDITRRTLEEHLRRAERKLVESFLKFMRW